MNEVHDRSPVVYTQKASCRDCYRCLRACPVKAIRMKDAQASVVDERCLSCGTCIRYCPQGAKRYRTDLERAEHLLRGSQPVAVSLAPSFVSVFQPWEVSRLATALRKLGFCFVAETAVGAHIVSKQAAQWIAAHPGRPHIWSSCPSAIRYVQVYFPELVEHLVPVVSPMIAHAQHLKSKLGSGAKVVFIGPCVAKKAEAQSAEAAGAVDAVLTFEELLQWLEREKVSLGSCEESAFDETPAGDARFFPLEGGSLRAAGLHTMLADWHVQSASGFEHLTQALQCLRQEQIPVVLETLFCSQGCVHGPAMGRDRNVFRRRADVSRYAEEHPGISDGAVQVRPLREVRWPPQPAPSTPVREEDILAVLEKTGKTQIDEQLNCGACGYASCRDKAIAVLQGMAEPSMCMPYMRRQAEQRMDRIIETSPNGIVILDSHLQVVSMNPAFCRMFCCGPDLYGKRISCLMDSEPFERLAAGSEPVLEVTVHHTRPDLVCHQIMYTLPGEQQYVGIFVNLNSAHADTQKLEQLRKQTMAQAQELLEHQVAMAQHIAQFLGESTAKGEVLVENLLRLVRDPSESRNTGKPWPWHIYTSK